MGLDLPTLRALFRGLSLFEAAYLDHGIDLINGPDGTEYSLWDLRYLVSDAMPLLPSRQAEAIHRCLIENHIESKAARLMGLTPKPRRRGSQADHSNPVMNAEKAPVAIYANDGLRNILRMIDDGKLPRFKPSSNGHYERALGRARSDPLPTGV